MLLLGLLLVSYLLFVFLAESLNPFASCKNGYKRPYKKLGVSAAFASLLAGLFSIGLIFYGQNERFALIVYPLLTLILLVPSLLRFKQRKMAH